MLKRFITFFCATAITIGVTYIYSTETGNNFLTAFSPDILLPYLVLVVPVYFMGGYKPLTGKVITKSGKHVLLRLYFVISKIYIVIIGGITFMAWILVFRCQLDPFTVGYLTIVSFVSMKTVISREKEILNG